MSDYLQRLVVRHFSTVPRILPNANTYFSAGAELAATEPIPEAGTAVDAVSEGVEVTAPGAFGKPVQPVPNRQPTPIAEAIHRAARGTPGAPPDVSAGDQRAHPRRSTAISTPDVAPTSDRDDNHSQQFTSSPVQQPTVPPGSQAGRSEPPEVAAVNRSQFAASQYTILPGLPAETLTVSADSVMPSASGSVTSSRPDLNYTKADVDVAVPTSEAKPTKPNNSSAAVPSPRQTRSRRAVPPSVPDQAPIAPANPVARLAPGRLTPSYSPSHSVPSRTDSKPATLEVATAAGIEPTAAITATHTAVEREPRSPASHRNASILSSAQQDTQDPVATVAPRPLAAQPIAPIAAAMPIVPPSTATPRVTISIGTIEVRAAPPPHPTVMQPASAISSPRLSLDEYLRRRNGSGV